MNAATRTIFEAAIALPANERADLADKLWISLGDYCDQIERAWLEECHRRVASIERGEIKDIPADEALQSVRESLKRFQASNRASN